MVRARVRVGKYNGDRLQDGKEGCEAYLALIHQLAHGRIQLANQTRAHRIGIDFELLFLDL